MKGLQSMITSKEYKVGRRESECNILPSDKYELVIDFQKTKNKHFYALAYFPRN